MEFLSPEIPVTFQCNTTDIPVEYHDNISVEYCHYSSGSSVVPLKSSTVISVEIPLVRKTVLFHG